MKKSCKKILSKMYMIRETFEKKAQHEMIIYNENINGEVRIDGKKYTLTQLDSIIDALSHKRPGSDDDGSIIDFMVVESVLDNCLEEFSVNELGIMLDEILKYNQFIINECIVIDYSDFLNAGFNFSGAQKVVDAYMDPKKNKDMDEKMKVFIGLTLRKQAVELNKKRENYNYIIGFKTKKTISSGDYDKLLTCLKEIGMSEKSSAPYIYYLKIYRLEQNKIKKQKEKEKVEIKKVVPKKIKEPVKVPRGKLKNKLYSLYHPDEEDVYFDLKDLKEVLTLSKQLSFTDERIMEMIYDILKKSIKNKDYYNYILSKITYLNQNADKYKGKFDSFINNVTEYKTMYEEYDDESNRSEIRKDLIDLFKDQDDFISLPTEYEEELQADQSILGYSNLEIGEIM